METFLPTLIVSLCILLIALLAFSIRIFVIKNGAFKGGCASASNNPIFRNEVGACDVCGATPEEACQK